MASPFQPQKFIAANVRDIPRSGIREFFDLVQNMTDVISLGVGEPDFVTPWHIREAAIYALERGKTSYTSNLGLLKLREAISAHLEKQFRRHLQSAKRNPHCRRRERSAGHRACAP